MRNKRRRWVLQENVVGKGGKREERAAVFEDKEEIRRA